ncbi:uncharacterized protein LOC135432319 [Drosophila montana]|uniref:uncharacterized protein LOC135432319 n=1 Tax=Drosophila montana TaxID=40370 RepID=UPI00313A8F10
MVCTSNDVKDTTCNGNGLLVPPLPFDDCTSQPKATAEVVQDKSCPHKMYRVGYKLDDGQFLELYRSCYDVEHLTAHFVKHSVYPNTLSIARPPQGFTTDRVISGNQAASFEASRIYSRFASLLGQQQGFVKSKRDMVFDRGHLAPSADFNFGEHMSATFKYINLVAQYQGVNRGNWKTIETWIRKQANMGPYRELQVCTGGLGVLQLPDSSQVPTAIYLEGTNSNPVPKWLFKIVKDVAATPPAPIHIAILTYNNIENTGTVSPPCQQILCPFANVLNSDGKKGLTFCCDPKEFIRNNVPHLENVC